MSDALLEKRFAAINFAMPDPDPPMENDEDADDDATEDEQLNQ